MTSAPASDTAAETHSRQRFRVLASLAFGLAGAVLAGGGVYFHDGTPAAAALITAGGFFVFGFVLMYVRLFRRLAEAHSALG